MLFGNLTITESYRHLLKGSPWEEILDWCSRQVGQDPMIASPEGEHEIQGRDIFASVQTVTAVPRQECRPESHRQYTDLHLCVNGPSENIEWSHPIPLVKGGTPYDEENDVILYSLPQDRGTTLRLTPGSIAVFFPGEIHTPRISTESESYQLTKVVVKIRKNLFQ